MLPLLVSIRFQVLFHSPPGVLFTFPSQYYYSISHQVVFRVGRWSPRLPTEFHVIRSTLDMLESFSISNTRLSLSLALLPSQILLQFLNFILHSSTPAASCWFALFPFRSPLLWKSIISFSSSPYLDVSVQAVPSTLAMYSLTGNRPLVCQVSPFGYLWIIARVQLPIAFRSFLRPSSAIGTQAFPLCSSLI